MLTRISHVAIRVTNLNRALEFYLKIPDITEHFRISQANGTPWLVYLRVGRRQFVELFPDASQPLTPSTGSGYAHVCFEVDDINEMYNQIVAAGIKTHGEPMLGADNSWQFWISDPDGNMIEFHQFTADSLQLKSEDLRPVVEREPCESDGGV